MSNPLWEYYDHKRVMFFFTDCVQETVGKVPFAPNVISTGEQLDWLTGG